MEEFFENNEFKASKVSGADKEELLERTMLKLLWIKTHIEGQVGEEVSTSEIIVSAINHLYDSLLEGHSPILKAALETIQDQVIANGSVEGLDASEILRSFDDDE